MHLKHILSTSLSALCLLACTNVDCPLENVVTMNCGLYNAETKASLKISDTLTIKTGGTKDTTLLNRANGISSFKLPLRYAAKEDTLLLRFSNAAGQFATDTIFVLHDGHPHFESADCPLVVFHKLNSVRWTTHAMKTMPLAIDSIAIIKENVTYDNAQNLKIYLRSVVTQ